MIARPVSWIESGRLTAAGAVSVTRTLSCPAGTAAPLSRKSPGALRRASAISPAKPSRRIARTAIGVVAPARRFRLDGATRNSKSGRGWLMRSR